jgi:hypothetical protein
MNSEGTKWLSMLDNRFLTKFLPITLLFQDLLDFSPINPCLDLLETTKLDYLLLFKEL